MLILYPVIRVKLPVNQNENAEGGEHDDATATSTWRGGGDSFFLRIVDSNGANFCERGNEA